MSDDVVVRLSGVGKMYKIFASRVDALADALGVARLIPWRPPRHREFWALRDIDLNLRHGRRIGIIGRNGAGKTTLLKLLTGNLAPTEGTLEIRGGVQALLEAGGGLHPEFTGYENIRAALTYQGLTAAEIAEAEADIADFTELGEFLGQPFKVYSLGMQARLAFAIATAIKPEIMIVDEILGAGDAYFFGKSTERMRQLVDSGASVLIVSHALDQILRFCEEAIWLDRGKVVMRGPSMEVVQAYEKFIRQLEDRRLKAKSRKRRTGRYSAIAQESYVDQVLVRLTLRGAIGTGCDVTEITLRRDGAVEDRLLVGSAQDVDATQSAQVVLEPGDWSGPRRLERELCRSLTVGKGRRGGPEECARGSVLFWLWVLWPEARYEVDIRYRCEATGMLSAEVVRNGVIATCVALPTDCPTWTTERVPLGPPSQGQADDEEGTEPTAGRTARAPSGEGVPATDRRGRWVSRWPGQGSLTIEEVLLVDAEDHEQAVFQVSARMSVKVTVLSRQGGVFPVIPAALAFRMDGIVVTRHVGERTMLELRAGERVDCRLDFGPLMLGNGHYLLSVGLYRRLDVHDLEPSEFYDYFDRSYEFQVVGNPALHNELVRHPGEWRWHLSAASGGVPAADAGESASPYLGGGSEGTPAGVEDR